MSDTPSKKQSVANRWAAGSFIGLIFVFIFALILALLTALQLQHAVLEPQLNKNLHPTMGSVRSDVAILDAHDSKLAKINEEIQKLEAQITSLEEEQNRANSAIAIDESKIKDIIHGDAASHSADVPEAVQPFPDAPPNDGWEIKERIEQYEGNVRKDAAARTAQAVERFLRDLEKDLQGTRVDFDENDNAYRKAANEMDTAKNNIVIRRKSLIDHLPDRLNNDPNYRSLVEDFQQNEWLLGKFGFVPNTMLVLLLSISMGILGSLIYLARELVQGEVKPIGEMVFRIGLGAAVALALFFFASAGVLALSAGEQAQTNMSPYLISFLGITAGYLSDRVTAWMREVGERTFKLENPSEPDRWAVGLAQRVQPPLTPTALATGIEVPVMDVQAWIDIRKPVPYQFQQLVAAYMHVPRSQLFTDINPNFAH